MPTKHKIKAPLQNKKAVPDANASDSSTSTRKRKNASTKVTLSECKEFIENALNEKRITLQKAVRLRECFEKSESPTEIIHRLLCEQIPNKRNKTGYKCRICVLPLKGHICPYCPVCSTSEAKYIKDGDHVCFNCHQCFEAGKQSKKLVQVKIGEGNCSHGKCKGDEAAVALLGLSKGT